MRARLIVTVLLVAGFCFAMEVPVSLETLVKDSDRILRGKVVSLSYQAGTNEFGDELIFTNVSIRTIEAFKGDRSDLVLTVEGGTLNGVTLAVSHAPEFRVGEEVLVFAKRELTTFKPPYGSQSKYTISKNGIVVGKGVHFNQFKRELLEAIRKGDRQE